MYMYIYMYVYIYSLTNRHSPRPTDLSVKYTYIYTYIHIHTYTYIYPTYHNCPVAPFSSTPAISGLSAVHPSRERPAPPKSPCLRSLRRLSSGSSGESICIIRVSLSCGSGPEGAEGRGVETCGVPLSGWMFGGVESGFKSCSRLSSLSVSCRRRVSCRLALARRPLSSCIYHVYIDDDISTVWGIYTHIHIHMHIHMHIHIHRHMHTDKHTRTHVHARTHARTRRHKPTYEISIYVTCRWRIYHV